MEPETAQIVTASLAVGGTLAAALLTQVLGARSDRKRREAEDESRWLADRLRVNARFLAQAISLERDLYSTAAQLDTDERTERMPGYTTVLLTPEEGVPDVFDDITRAIIVETVEGAFIRLHQLEELAAEIALIGTEREARAANKAVDALLDATGALESYVTSKQGYAAVLAAQDARKDFADAARLGLRSGIHKES